VFSIRSTCIYRIEGNERFTGKLSAASDGWSAKKKIKIRKDSFVWIRIGFSVNKNVRQYVINSSGW
jgi:hypothetical protein